MLEGFKPLSDKIKKKPNKAIVSTNGRISLPKEILEQDPNKSLSKARCDLFINDDTSEVAIKIYRSYRIKDWWDKPNEQAELDEKLEGDYNIHNGVVSIAAALTERDIEIQESFSAEVRQEGEYYIISLAPNLDLKKVKDMLTSKILKMHSKNDNLR